MSFKFISKLIFVLSVLTTINCNAEIWPTQNKWNESVKATCTKWPEHLKQDCADFISKNIRPESTWSDVYSLWVNKFWYKEIYIDENSPLKGIATDCADASYGMRIYFSWLFNLEFKIRYPGIKDRFITNLDNNFNQIGNPTNRLRSFLIWLGGLVSTRTLPDDTYPIALNSQFFKPGILFTTSTHTDQLVEIDNYGIGRFLYSTVPIELRSLKELVDYPSSVPTDFTTYKDGYRAFIEPQNYGKSISQIPGYSLEQFELVGAVAQRKEKHTEPLASEIGQFYENLQRTFQKEPEPIGRKVKRYLNTLCEQTRERVILIQSSLNLNASKCISSAKTYDEFSTPSRDRQLKNLYEKGVFLYQTLQDPLARSSAMNESNKSVALKEDDIFVLDTIFGNSENEIKISYDWSDRFCQLEPLIKNPDSRKLTLRRIWQKISTNALVPDPNATFYQRWGFEPYEAKCPVLEY